MRSATSWAFSELSKPIGIGLSAERSMERMSERLMVSWREGSKALTASSSLSPSSLRMRPIDLPPSTRPMTELAYWSDTTALGWKMLVRTSAAAVRAPRPVRSGPCAPPAPPMRWHWEQRAAANIFWPLAKSSVPWALPFSQAFKASAWVHRRPGPWAVGIGVGLTTGALVSKAVRSAAGTRASDSLRMLRTKPLSELPPSASASSSRKAKYCVRSSGVQPTVARLR